MKIGKSRYESLLKELDRRVQKRKFADAVTCVAQLNKSDAQKGFNFLYENNEDEGTCKRTIVANTYNWIDSHGDVHLPGIFAKSIADRGVKIPHLHDHKFEIAARVGRVIAISEKEMKWRALGHPKNGSTSALVVESKIERKLNAVVYDEYLADNIDQHSVAMNYVDIKLAVSDDEYKSEHELWQEVYPQLGNKEVADKVGAFYVVSEAELLEVSAVLLGSNALTPTLLPKRMESYTTLSELLESFQPSKYLN